MGTRFSGHLGILKFLPFRVMIKFVFLNSRSAFCLLLVKSMLKVVY
jgi:hypothetical protein